MQLTICKTVLSSDHLVMFISLSDFHSLLFYQDSLKVKTVEVEAEGNVNLATEPDNQTEENTAM